METNVLLDSDQFAEFYLDSVHDTVEQRWLTATKSMTEEQFRVGVQRLAELLERESTKHALVDVTNMQYAPSPEFEAWRQANIIPRYNAAGIEKFAFLLPAGAPNTVETGNTPAKEGAANFPFGYFTSREHVFSWFGT